MNAEERLGFGARLWLAFILPWKILFDAVFAAQAARLARGLPAPEPPKPEPSMAGRMTLVDKEPRPVVEAPKPEPPKPAPPAKPDPVFAVQMLAILQREGRFVDFLQEDVAAYADADIGAAARIVHEGCRKALREYVTLEPVRDEAEGAPVTLDAGFDPSRVRLTGNVVGGPPFRGRLAHHGWQATDIKLPVPPDGHDPRVVAPAEVEL
jgi:hypothetical protein